MCTHTHTHTHTLFYKKLAVALYLRITPSAVSDMTVTHYVTCMLGNQKCTKNLVP
jgi:hypothetical protein